MENIKIEIESISEKLGVPVQFIENAIKQARLGYLQSNAYTATGYTTGLTKNISENIFGVNLDF